MKLKEIVTSKATDANKQVSRMKERGITPDQNSEEFLKAIQEMEIESENNKNLIFEKNGLAGHEDAPAVLLRRAQQKYSVTETGFKQRMAKLEEEYSSSMELIMKDSFPYYEIQRLEKKYSSLDT